MNWLALVILGVIAFVLSGPVGMLGRRSGNGWHWVSAAVAVAGGMCGLVAAFAVLLGSPSESLTIPAAAPAMTVNLRIGPLSAFFLIPIFAIGSLSSIYGLGYWPQSRHPRNGRKLRLWYGLLIAGMALLTLCQNSIDFLVAWEMMALSTFFLILTEDQKSSARQAAWVYLVATHLGTLLLVALFAIFRVINGSFLLRPLVPDQVGLALQTVIFLLATVGFGLKAGIVPLHFWLPEAHANAPSHVSATLSGVTLKMGIFGILRVLTLLPARPPAWGIFLLGLGAVSAFLGVLWAIAQHDLKKLLAYHSVENIGIILMGLGLALVGQAEHHPIWIILGMAGCLLHVWNHGLFKSLLFLSAGSVIHGTGTRDIDQLGGLAKSMKITAAAFLLGALAICGLPPLNGFVSEFLIYLGLFHTMARLPILSLTAAILAMVGALAAACFTKAYGSVFLGTSRRVSHRAHESGPTLWIPMGLLAAGCVLIGIAPSLVLTPLIHATATWSGQPSPELASLVPVKTITILGVGLLAAFGAGWVGQRYFLRRDRTGITWGCGYIAPSSRMQYTASSLAQMLLRALGPLVRQRRCEPQISAVFAGTGQFETHADDPVLKDAVEPVWRRLRFMLAGGQGFQRGSIQNYIFYMLLTVLVLLAFTLPLAMLWNWLL